MKKVLVVHKYYRHRGGEDVFLDEVLIPTLKKLNLQIELLTLSSLEWLLEAALMVLGFEKLRPSYLKTKSIINKQKIDAAVLNNFIPTLSLDLPVLLESNKIKTFAWVHNARLICANGLVFDGKKECYDCLQKSSLRAFIKNCNGHLLQSLLYAWIYRGQRISKKLSKTKIQFLPISNFAASFLEKALIKNYTVTTIPPKDHTLKAIPAELNTFINRFNGKFYLYAGRLSYEKGIDRLIDLAKKLPQKIFVICGSGPLEKSLPPLANIIVAQVNKGQLHTLYKQTEALIVPSRVKETASLVISESQFYGTPVVYPKGGGAEETVKLLNRNAISFEDFNGQPIEKSKVDMEKIKKMSQDFESKLGGFF